jgi:seryl-tRNA synthetase
MFDIKAIRENPDEFDRLWAKRGLEAQSKNILDQDKLIRKAMQVVQEAEAARNKASKQIGAAMGKGDKEEAERLKAEVAGAKNVIAAMGAQVESEKAVLAEKLASLPNLPFHEVPDGDGEEDNEEVSKWGEPKTFEFKPKGHDELGAALGQMDFETAAKMSGSRFVVLRGALSRMDRALAALMLDMQTEEGFEETSPPFLVWPRALHGTGQLPKFAEDLYKAGEDHYLIPTAEVSLTNTVRETILDEDTLPLRMTAHTPCFRSEAGAAGRDTKGMIRQHQFNKVGFGARKTYDIEVWLPSQDTYREISSISNCGDFQARRMNARYKHGPKDNRFVHTLNGSGLAVGRTLVAVLENYQNEDGTITVPEALVPYMGGLEVIG